MSENSNLEPADWQPSGNGDVTYHEVNDEATWRGDPSVHDEIMSRFQRHVLEHHVVTSLQALRRLLGRTQVEIAEVWGRPQSQVSRLENDPERAELGSVLAYVHALGGKLAIEAEIEGELFRYELT
jgi:hypothetical protein